jgi:hypothetical protein
MIAHAQRSGAFPDAKRRPVADHRSMQIALRKRRKGRRSKAAGMEMARTLSVAAQMALLCPSGMDVWMQRELSGCSDFDRPGRRRAS